MNRNLRERLRSVKLFLLDLDGTVYLGGKPIAGAIDFVRNCRRCGIEYLFVTNNSSKSASEYEKKLSGMGFPVGAGQVLTSGEVTGWYLAGKKPGATLYVVGTVSLKAELAAHDLQVVDGAAGWVDYVVAGFDRELTYDKLLPAIELLSAGAPFIATNPDLVCPVGEGRYIPDCGSICVLLENATRRVPMYIGKPHTTLIDYLRARRRVSPRSMAVIGDRLYTDIALGCNASIMSVCVLSGESDRAAVARSPYQPDLVVETIAALNRYLE
ncbi:MAG: HAD-IIA family hydrolase [Chitinispirillaceae bacterium]|nr:HAD-IIA family hydrolase [Chitinispirillaceae bacterium]